MSQAHCSKLRQFAINPQSQALLVSDADMLKSLIQFLDPCNEPAIIFLALEGVFALAANASHRKVILGYKGLLVTLSSLCEYDEDPAYNAKISALAKKTLSTAQGIVNPDVPAKENEKAIHIPVATHRASAFGVRGYLHNFSLSIPELIGESARARVEAALISTKGVVSVVIDLPGKKATLYSASKKDEMANKCIDSLTTAGFSSSLLVDDKNKPQDNGGSSSGDSDRPSYIQRGATNKDALVNYAEKAAKKPTQQNGGWFGSITSYFW